MKIAKEQEGGQFWCVQHGMGVCHGGINKVMFG